MKFQKRSLPKNTPPTNDGNIVTIVFRSTCFKYHYFEQIKARSQHQKVATFFKNIFVSHLTLAV